MPGSSAARTLDKVPETFVSDTSTTREVSQAVKTGRRRGKAPGRTARIAMNAELAAADEQRIVIPTVYRANYLSALKALSQNRRAERPIRMLDYAQKWTAAFDWRTVEETRRELDACNAFLDPDVADEEGTPLRMPGRVGV